MHKSEKIFYKSGWIVIAILVAILYVRYGIIMILRDSSVIMDVILYSFALFAVLARSRYNWLIICVLFIFASLALVNPASKNIFIIILTVYLLSPLSLRQIAAINLSLQTIFFLWILLMLFSGDLVDKNYVNTYELDTRSNRWDFGFGNPNIFALFIYAVILNLSIVLKNHKLFNLAITIVLTVLITWYTGSRSFQLSMFAFIITYIFILRKSLRNLIISTSPILYLLPMACMAVTLYFSYYVSDYPLVNLLLSGRPQLYNFLIAESTPIQYIIGNPDVMEDLIDSGYLHLLFEGGIFAFLVYYILYANYISKLNKENLYFLPIVLSSLVYGLTESVQTSILNYGVIIVWSILYGNWIGGERSISKKFKGSYDVK